MELYRTQILLEKSQYKRLSLIAQEESRSLSEIVREMIDRELLMLGGRELQPDYNTNPVLTEFTALDGDNFLLGEDDAMG